MEKTDNAKLICHKMAGVLNFLGGAFDEAKVANMKFGDVVDSLDRNGGAMGITITKEHFERSNKIRP